MTGRPLTVAMDATTVTNQHHGQPFHDVARDCHRPHHTGRRPVFRTQCPGNSRRQRFSTRTRRYGRARHDPQYGRAENSQRHGQRTVVARERRRTLRAVDQPGQAFVSMRRDVASDQAPSEAIRQFLAQPFQSTLSAKNLGLFRYGVGQNLIGSEDRKIDADRHVSGAGRRGDRENEQNNEECDGTH